MRDSRRVSSLNNSAPADGVSVAVTKLTPLVRLTDTGVQSKVAMEKSELVIFRG